MNEKSDDTKHWTEAELRQHVEQNVTLFSSQALADHVREKHFSAGLPIIYLDPNAPDCLIEEHPDGRQRRIALQARSGNNSRSE